MRFKIKEKKDIEMAEIMGTVTSIKLVKTSCNSFGIELTQHKYFSKEVTRWKTWFSKMKK